MTSHKAAILGGFRVIVAWMARYDVTQAGVGAGPVDGVFVLDRWAGTSFHCTVDRCSKIK